MFPGDFVCSSDVVILKHKYIIQIHGEIVFSLILSSQSNVWTVKGQEYSLILGNCCVVFLQKSFCTTHLK